MPDQFTDKLEQMGDDMTRTRPREISVATAPDSRKPAPVSGFRKPRSNLPVEWLTTPQKHDYPAARSYLSLTAESKTVEKLVVRLKRARVVYFKAKDILRASGLPLLPPDNKHVAADLTRISSGQPLSPCLLVRGDFRLGQPAQIADGYHRVCASYHVNENTDIPVKIASL